MMGQTVAQLLPLGIAERRRRGIVQNAVEQAVRQFQPLVRGQLLELLEESGFGHAAKVRLVGFF